MRNAVAFGLLAVTACSATPDALPLPPPRDPPKQPAAPALPPSRWVYAGPSHEGVRVAGGRLVLLLGKRALVADDGAVTLERVAAPEPLEDLLLVPTSSGTKVLGRAGKSVYGFDEPLGAATLLATAPGPLLSAEAGPDVILLRTTEGAHWVGLDGKARPRFGPPLPLRFVHFVDTKRGMAVLDAAGVVVTSDGGSTWRLVPKDLRGLSFDGHDGLRAEGDAVDADAASVAPWSPGREPTLVGWLREAALAPLEAAVRGGVDLGNGRALVVARGQSFEVDLSTGLPGPFTDLPATPDRNGTWRGATMLGGEVAIFWSEGGMDPPLVAGLRPRSSPRIAPGIAQASAGERGASGAFSLTGPCDDASVPERLFNAQLACVRQPGGGFVGGGFVGGGFVPIWTEGSATYASAPSLSGGVVAAMGAGEPRGAEGAELVRVDQKGAIRRIATLPKLEELDVQLDELDDSTVHVLLTDPDLQVRSLLVSGRDVATRKLGAGVVKYSAGRGFFTSEGGFQVTADAGRTWTQVPAPSLVGAGSVLGLSEVGLMASPYLRVGWGAQAPIEPFFDWTKQRPTLAAPSAPAELVIQCKPGKRTKSALPFADPADFFAGGLSPLGPPSGAAPIRSTHLNPKLRTQAAAELTLSSQSKLTLTLHWVDQSELGAKVRSATGPAPGGMRRADIYNSFASGDRAFFELSDQGELYFARAVGGKLEVVALPKTWRPVRFAVGVLVRDAAIAQDGAVSWVGTEAAWGPAGKVTHGIGVWLPREAPRIVAAIRGGQLAISAPTLDGIPLLSGSRELSAYRVVPVPRASGKRGPAEPAWVDVAGWKEAPVLPSWVGALSVCGAKAPPARFVLSGSKLPVVIEGFSSKVSATSAVIATDGVKACVESVVSQMENVVARVNLRTKKGEASRPVLTKQGPFELSCEVVPPRLPAASTP